MRRTNKRPAARISFELAAVVPLISKHVAPIPGLGDLPARTIIGAAFNCLDAALAAWAETDAAVPFRATLDATFAAMTREVAAQHGV